MSFTKSQTIDALAEKAGIEKKTAEAMLDALAQLAYEHAKEEFTLPGIGKLVVVDRKSRFSSVIIAIDAITKGSRTNSSDRPSLCPKQAVSDARRNSAGC